MGWVPEVSEKKKPGEIPDFFLEEERGGFFNVMYRPCWCLLSS